MNARQIKRIKKMLGLPPRSRDEDVVARISHITLAIEEARTMERGTVNFLAAIAVREGHIDPTEATKYIDMGHRLGLRAMVGALTGRLSVV